MILVLNLLKPKFCMIILNIVNNSRWRVHHLCEGRASTILYVETAVSANFYGWSEFGFDIFVQDAHIYQVEMHMSCQFERISQRVNNNHNYQEF